MSASELAGALEEVFADFRRKFKEFQDSEPLWSIILGFAHAIDWKEPWIIALVSCQVLLLLLALFTRRHTTIQTVLFALAMSVVYLGERLNRLGHQHWQSFSSQDYFDGRGVFFSALVSGPLLLTMFIVVINYLITCAGLLVKAKAMQLKHKAKLERQRQQQEASGGASSTDAAAGSSSSSRQPGDKKRQ